MPNTTNGLYPDEAYTASSTSPGEEDDFQQKVASFVMYKIGKLSVCIAIEMISKQKRSRDCHSVVFAMVLPVNAPHPPGMYTIKAVKS